MRTVALIYKASVFSYHFFPSQAPPFCLSSTFSLSCSVSLMLLKNVCVWVAGGGYSECRRHMSVHQGLIAVCIETSVISQHSLPCRPANNQHPLCACSCSHCLSSLSPSLSSLVSCLLPQRQAPVRHCSPLFSKNKGGGY